MASTDELRVVIVGAGFCGLTAAIECKLRGMHPILVEAYPGASSHGDLLDFVRNAGRVFESWGGGKVGRALTAVGVNAAKYLEFFNADNELLHKDPWPQGTEFQYVYAGHRGEMHEIVYSYALEIGVDMRFNTRVAKYLDTDEERGVVTDTGEKILGDVVLACDGPKSIARDQLLNLTESKVNSGYAIFRAYFNITDELRQAPGIAELLPEGEDCVRCWVVGDMHGFIYTWKNGRDCAWVLTHKDETDIAESWSEKTTRADVRYFLNKAKFPEVWYTILEATPEDRLIDYKLVWRDPLTTWLSPTKRAAVMGDAAHCHLPTSAQGACQAVEDAAVVAMCLEKSKGDVELALQVFERIRFNRSHVVHQASISTRNIYHQHDCTPEYVAKHPSSLVIPLFDWITEYDVYKEVDAHFDHLAEEVRSGKQGTIEQLSLPAGGNYDEMEINANKEVLLDMGSKPAIVALEASSVRA
ncbi:FAD binding domain protein [Colletotrichum asianum]|uniref:FAD binding domain protein n=1 Tax=Colletotrichum asianum TaxID=702518 RepID=A0A8H3WFS5_9PEZI|nr:FAD binding domain protein [Colletotrichum asianum]